tara:strand:- start:444 stop:590 length:147 start_codon:yes stop_codon:yes gene_type:complete
MLKTSALVDQLLAPPDRSARAACPDKPAQCARPAGSAGLADALLNSSA